MPDFFVVALILMLLACCFVLFPLMMNRSDCKTNHSGINISLFKRRLSELEAEQQAGDLEAAEFKSLKIELERRLLDEASKTGAISATEKKHSLITSLCIAIVIPIIAYSFYNETGAMADWEITETISRVRQQAAVDKSNGDTANMPSEKTMIGLVKQLESRLEKHPENGHYLKLLGTTHMQLENYPAASGAFHRLSLLVPDNPSVLAEYAQALYLASNRSLSKQVMKVSNRALAQDPQQPIILSMLGIASFEKGEYQQAINYWQRLIPVLPPGSTNRNMIQSGIDQAKKVINC